MDVDYQISEIRENEYPILSDFLYEAIFIPEGIEKLPKSIIKQPELQIYVVDFGKDCEAVWVSIVKDYGHADDALLICHISL